MPHPAAKSAIEINLSANANSTKPSNTLIVLSHPPDLGKECNNDGNIAKKVNGKAKATEKPSIPINGPSTEPVCTDSTNNVPIIIAVHENETKTKVKAIKNTDNNPDDESTFLSILLTQLEGRFMSNAPKNEIAN